jgi:hypothetical protein
MGQAGLHTNFKLSSLGENLIFSNGATVYDQVTFGVQTTDVAYARCPDGGATFELVNPTPEANNGCQASISELEEAFQLKLFPNPFSELLNIEFGESSNITVKISDLQGRIIYSNSIGFGLNQLNVSNWSNGVYYATFEKSNGQKLTVNLVK